MCSFLRNMNWTTITHCHQLEMYKFQLAWKKNFTGSWCWFRYNELKMNRQQHVLLYWMLYRNSSAQQMYVDEIFWHDNMWDILSYRYMHEIMNINPCLYDLYLIQMLQKHSFCIIIWNGRPDNMGSFKQYPKKICVCTSESQTNIFIQKLIYRNLKAFGLTLKKRNLAYPYSKIEHSLCNNRTPLFFCASTRKTKLVLSSIIYKNGKQKKIVIVLPEIIPVAKKCYPNLSSTNYRLMNCLLRNTTQYIALFRWKNFVLFSFTKTPFLLHKTKK